jgi:ATP-dependent helicase/nuclease subunit A
MSVKNPQVLCLEASAGSGKTYALARRYVQLSLHLAASRPVAIQSILAITFTNKATSAMKLRILDFLKRIALKQLNPREEEDILPPGMDKDRASQLAFVLMNDVVRQYHYFQVQTIDSFVNILLVGCSFKIGLSARFTILRDPGEYLQLSLDELLDRAGSDKPLRGLFEDFVRRYMFLENRSGWFPARDLLDVISELFRKHNVYQKPFLPYAPQEDILPRKRKIFSMMQELKELCPPQTTKKFTQSLEAILSSPKDIFDVDDLSGYFSQEDFPVNKEGDVSPELFELWRRLTREIRGLCLLEARSAFNPYVALFEKALSCFGRISRRDDVLFLQELNRKAALLFEEGLVTVEELYFRLAARLEHYLVDEFQDTSVAQWRNLSLLVEEALAHGGSLFYVGDKKQAIYSFRGGESLLFDALQSQLSGFNVQATALDKNYRSCPEIIAFNNKVFSLDNLSAFLQRRRQDAIRSGRGDVQFSPEDFGTIADAFAHALQTRGSDLAGGVVRVTYLDGRVKKQRLADSRQRVMLLIADLRSRFALKDIAVLTRGNQEVEEVTQWLLEEGVGVSSERSSDIKGNPLIGELMSLLSFLDSPADNDAFAQVCLGEMFPAATGLSPQALRDFLFECARHSRLSKEIYFYEEFRKDFPQVWQDFFEDFLLRAGRCPLYELACGLIGRLGCERHFPGYQGFIMHFLELIKKHEAESCDLPSFLAYFEKLEGEDRFVPMTGIDAVKVLTVHKAKGLEFPVVIVPFLEMDVKAGGGPSGGQSYILDIEEEGLRLVRLKEVYRQFCPEIQERYEQEYRKSFLAELNSVYVALTRAVEELYIFVPSRVGNAVNPAMFLIPEDGLEAGTPVARPAAHEPPENRQKISPFVSDAWEGLQKEFSDQPASAVLARKGEFYHALLMHMGELSGGRTQALEKAWEGACRLMAPSAAREEVLADIAGFIDRPDVSPFFELPPDAQVFCEKEFVNAYGDSRRIDRLVVRQNEVMIADFKLSREAESAHRKQMKEYIELVQEFYPGRKVSGHILYLKD